MSVVIAEARRVALLEQLIPSFAARENVALVTDIAEDPAGVGVLHHRDGAGERGALAGASPVK